jgi:hypothetical protein
MHFVGSSYVCRLFSRCLCNTSPQETNACPHFLTCAFHTDWTYSVPTPSVYRKFNIKSASKRDYVWLIRRVYGNNLGWKWTVNTALNPLTPNDLYISRTTPLTSKRCISYIYSTNVGTEYFKHALYSPFSFSLQNAVCFIMLTSLVPALFTFYIQDVLKLKKK